MSAASLRGRGAHAGFDDTDGLFPAAGVVVASFAAVGFFTLPQLARADGFPGAGVALVGVTVPLAAAALATRLWALQRIGGARGMGELLHRHYGAGVAGIGGLLAAAGAVALLAHILQQAAELIEVLSRSAIRGRLALYLTALFVALTAAPAGIRAAGAMARVHAALVAAGVSAAVILAIAHAGGPDAAIDALARIGDDTAWGTTLGRGGGDYNAALAVGGVAQSVSILSTQAALGGTLLVLIWLPWTSATPNPRRFGGAQIWMLVVLAAALLFVLAFLLGLVVRSEATVTGTLGRLAGERIWAVAALGLGGIAALHALAISLIGTVVGSLRPLWTARGMSTAGRDVAWAQGIALAAIGMALLSALAPVDDLERARGIAMSLTLLAVLPLAAVAWFPRLTRAGLIAGLIVGCAVAFTAPAVVAVIAAMIVAAAASIARPHDSRRLARLEALRTIAAASAQTSEERVRTSVAWFAVIAWIFFAIGPGALVGNDLFGAPDAPRAQWDFPLPSIAIWQALSWLTGIGLVWFLARGMGLAATRRGEAAGLMTLNATGQTDRQTADR